MSLGSDLRHTAIERARREVRHRTVTPFRLLLANGADPRRDRQTARPTAITPWNIRNVCTFQPSCLIRPRTRSRCHARGTVTNAMLIPGFLAA
jgi:hypothetical protein